MTGNPLVAAGSFYDSHHSKREMYATVQIGAGDTPNVALDDLVIPGMITREDMADRKQDWGETSPLYLGSILGRFPDNLDLMVVPLSYADDAAHRSLQPAGPVVVACDVARYGHGKTVVMRRQGPRRQDRLEGPRTRHHEDRELPQGLLRQRRGSTRSSSTTRASAEASSTGSESCVSPTPGSSPSSAAREPDNPDLFMPTASPRSGLP